MHNSALQPEKKAIYEPAKMQPRPVAPLAAKPKKVVTDEAKSEMKTARMLTKYPKEANKSAKPLNGGPARLVKVIDEAKKTRDVKVENKAKQANGTPTTPPVVAPVTNPPQPTMPTAPLGPVTPDA